MNTSAGKRIYRFVSGQWRGVNRFQLGRILNYENQRNATEQWAVLLGSPRWQFVYERRLGEYASESTRSG